MQQEDQEKINLISELNLHKQQVEEYKSKYFQAQKEIENKNKEIEGLRQMMQMTQSIRGSDGRQSEDLRRNLQVLMSENQSLKQQTQELQNQLQQFNQQILWSQKKLKFFLLQKIKINCSIYAQNFNYFFYDFCQSKRMRLTKKLLEQLLIQEIINSKLIQSRVRLKIQLCLGYLKLIKWKTRKEKSQAVSWLIVNKTIQAYNLILITLFIIHNFHLSSHISCLCNAYSIHLNQEAIIVTCSIENSLRTQRSV